MTVLSVAFLFALVAAFDPRVVAQEAALEPQARELFRQGLAAARQERWGEALELFRRSRALVERPSTVFNIGAALLRLGRPSEALVVLERYLEIADPEVESERIPEARRLLVDARAATGHVQLTVSPETAQIRVDGEVLDGHGSTRELELDPGTHRLQISEDGFEAVDLEVSLIAGERLERTVQLVEVVAPTYLTVTSAPRGGTIWIDGRQVGRGTFADRVEPGPHRLEVRAPGYLHFRRDLELQAGDAAKIHAALEEKTVPLYRRPLFWAAIGAAAAAAGVGLALALSSGRADPHAGTTGVVLQGLH